MAYSWIIPEHGMAYARDVLAPDWAELAAKGYIQLTLQRADGSSLQRVPAYAQRRLTLGDVREAALGMFGDTGGAFSMVDADGSAVGEGGGS